jgi:hypothetical protein
MGMRLTIVLGASIGLVVSGGVLGLLWFGVSGVLEVGHTDLMYVLWPSSLVLVGGWHATPLGILITFFAVVANCLVYSGVALILRWGLGSLAKILSTRRTAS